MANLFIGYHPDEKLKAEKLAKALQNADHEVWFGPWKILLGDSRAGKITEGLQKSDYFIFCFTAEENAWLNRQLMSTMSRQLDGRPIKILPARFSMVEPPYLLSDYRYADFSDDWEKGFQVLISALIPQEPKHPEIVDGLEKEVLILHEMEDTEIAKPFIERIRKKGYIVYHIGQTKVGESYHAIPNKLRSKQVPVVFCATKSAVGDSFLVNYINGMGDQDRLDRLLVIVMKKGTAIGNWSANTFQPIPYWTNPVDKMEDVLSELDKVFQLLVQKTILGSKTELLTWPSIRESAQLQVSRFMKGVKMTTGSTGAYNPELQVTRRYTDDAFEAFLNSEKQGLVIAGESGNGVTNIMCRWTESLINEGHCVYIYDCPTQVPLKIEEQIATDLNSNASLWSDVFKRIDSVAQEVQKKIIIILDEIHGFKERQDGPAEFLKHVHALIERLPGKNISVVMTCNLFTWKRLYADFAKDFPKILYHTTDLGGYVQVEEFTDSEAREAYQKHLDYFVLKTTWEELHTPVRIQLHKPILMRMLSETRRGKTIPDKQFSIKLFEDYYLSRVEGPDSLFLVTLADRMLNQQSAKIELDLRIYNDKLIRDQYEDPESSFWALQKKGIMVMSQGGRFRPSNYSFVNGRIAAIVFASYLKSISGENEESIKNKVIDLVKQVDQFPLARDIARTLIVLSGGRELHQSLASNPSPDVRELVVESLRELFIDDPVKILKWLKSYLKTNELDVWRTTLKSAFYIGPGASSIFAKAIKGNPALLEEARKMLYLLYKQSHDPGEGLIKQYILWKSDPDFVYQLLDDILIQLKITKISNWLGWRKNFDFFMGLSVIIYINHCERQDVINKTAALYQRLAIDNTFIFSNLDKIVGFVSSAFARPLMNVILHRELDQIISFFKRPLEERACLKRVAPLLNPDNSIIGHEEDIKMMLQSTELFYDIAAALILGIHGIKNFKTTIHFIESCMNDLNDHGKKMALAAFSIPWPDTPEEWIPMLESSTHNLILSEFYTPRKIEKGVFSEINLAFVPLGLAYGKREGGSTLSMPLFVEEIQRGLASGEEIKINQCLEALGPVGIYYPSAVLQTLRESISDFEEDRIKNSLPRLLGLMRTFYFDLVDEFYQEIGVGAEVKSLALKDSANTLPDKYVKSLGYYNNAVHFSINYPYMRKRLSQGAFELLARAKNENEFISQYSKTAVRMFQEVDGDLLQWTTRPE